MRGDSVFRARRCALCAISSSGPLCRLYDNAGRLISNSYANQQHILLMTSSVQYSDANHPPLRGICLVVKSDDRPVDRRKTIAARRAAFPRRPDLSVLSEAIPLFFIARNHHWLWVAREAEGRSGGIFLFRNSALRFAKRRSAGAGCATMFLSERLELDVDNIGSRLAAWLEKSLRFAGNLIPEYPPAIPLPPKLKLFEGKHR